MQERIIVTLTTWNKRIGNIPAVLETIFNQTLPPDLVVLNIAFDETIPLHVQKYIDSRPIEVFRVADTKAYKKILPTLKRYPNDCIINIDDDWIYPLGMIEDFINVHTKHPDFPISGNRVIIDGRQCHCGCASLLKASYFENNLDLIDDGVIKNCPSSDIVFTYFANKSKHPYIRTNNEYFINMKPYNDTDGYTNSFGGGVGISDSYKYLIERFGKLDDTITSYILDDGLSVLFEDILSRQRNSIIYNTEMKLRSSYSYRIGNFIIRPLSFLKHIISKK